MLFDYDSRRVMQNERHSTVVPKIQAVRPFVKNGDNEQNQVEWHLLTLNKTVSKGGEISSSPFWENWNFIHNLAHFVKFWHFWGQKCSNFWSKRPKYQMVVHFVPQGPVLEEKLNKKFWGWFGLFLGASDPFKFCSFNYGCGPIG